MTKPKLLRRAGWLLVPLTALGWVAGLLLLLGRPQPAAATNFVVGGPCGVTIQACINSNLVSAGDTLVLLAQTYTESVVMTKSVSLTGLPGQAAATIIRAPAGARVLQVTTFVTLPITINELTVTGGDAHGHGGGILLQSSEPATLTHVIFDNNRASVRGGGLSADSFVTLSHTTFISNASVDNGGGAYVEVATVTDSYFERNYCTGFCSGGAIVANQVMTLTNATVLSNSSAYHGGGVASGQHMTVNGGLFQGNSSNANGYGGGGLISFGSADISGALFIGNSALTYGGGINIWMTGTVANTTLLSNTVVLSNGYGGGAMLAFSTAAPSTISGSRFEGNSSGGFGGGMYSSGLLSMTDTNFVGNTAHRGSGGGAYSLGAAQLSRVTFDHNTVITGGNGGGLRAFSFVTGEELVFTSNTVQSGTLTVGLGGGAHILGGVLTDCTFVDNRAGGIYGGGLYSGNLILSGGAFTHNVVSLYTNNGGGGGGLAVFGMADISGTLFYSNTSPTWGGGAVLADFTGANITHTTFMRNAAGGGGGLVTWYTATLTHVDFLSNTSQFHGGGVFAGLVGVNSTTVTGGRFQDNIANHGGGLYSTGHTSVASSEFLRNKALFGNGGAAFLAGRTALIRNTLFAGNTANSAAGTALYLLITDTARILHSTFTAPSPVTGNAIQMGYTGTLLITNTIFTSHTVGILVAAGTAHEDYNLFFDVGVPVSSAGGGTHDVFGSPAFVNPLVDDYRLGITSMAIDNGAEGQAVIEDFEGDPRPLGLRPDIGYDEAPPRFQLWAPATYR